MSGLIERVRPKGWAWTEEEAVEYLQRLGRTVGGTPTQVDMAPYHSPIVRLFGSIRAAQEAAGFEPNKQSPGGGASQYIRRGNHYSYQRPPERKWPECGAMP